MVEPERTADGRYIVVNGRRWRASDPDIPETLRAELVHELMAARRIQARPRVQDAKVALGERGDPWWEPTESGHRTRLAAAIQTLLRDRGVDATVDLGDAARVVGGEDWRALLPLAREVAAELAAAGVVEVRQRDEPVERSTAENRVHLTRGRSFA